MENHSLLVTSIFLWKDVSTTRGETPLALEQRWCRSSSGGSDWLGEELAWEVQERDWHAGWGDLTFCILFLHCCPCQLRSEKLTKGQEITPQFSAVITKLYPPQPEPISTSHILTFQLRLIFKAYTKHGLVQLENWGSWPRNETGVDFQNAGHDTGDLKQQKQVQASSNSSKVQYSTVYIASGPRAAQQHITQDTKQVSNNYKALYINQAFKIFINVEFLIAKKYLQESIAMTLITLRIGCLDAHNLNCLHTHWYPFSWGAFQSQLQVQRKCKQPLHFRAELALLGDGWAQSQHALIHSACWLVGLLAADVILLLGGKLLRHSPDFRGCEGDRVPSREIR